VFDLGVITLKLDDVLERKLRDRAAQIHGLTRGSLSRAVEDALTVWLSSAATTQQKTSMRYSAFRAGKSLLEAPSLKELAKGLKKAGVDPRDVEIRSSTKPPRTEKLGLRVMPRREGF
jgi:hypothetical protein